MGFPLIWLDGWSIHSEILITLESPICGSPSTKADIAELVSSTLFLGIYSLFKDIICFLVLSRFSYLLKTTSDKD